MSSKKFISLIIISILLAVSAAMSINMNTQNYNFQNRGEVFLKGFTQNINNVNFISIESFDNTIDLVKKDNSYISESGYPLKKGMWENLITSLSLLRIEEKKTDDPDRHDDLNLKSPELNKSEDESEGYATKITLKKNDGIVYSSILFGKTDPSVGGLSGGQFARMNGVNQSYLLRGAIRMPGSKSDWFESLLFTIKNENFQKASLVKNFKVFEIENIKDALKVTYPQILDFKADQEKLSDVRDVIESFYFYDVKKSLDSYPDNLPTLSYVTTDGLILSISSISPEAKGESWVIIKAKSNNPKSKKLADEIINKTSGFQFLANINTSNILRWETADLKTQKVKN
ncbi:DUF4340 domain-containing protein [Alphaproteobacteria bacterium]|nr:DUF4340 domain-containing protein [Alphaproteobacteria bacterium]